MSNLKKEPWGSDLGFEPPLHTLAALRSPRLHRQGGSRMRRIEGVVPKRRDTFV